MGDDRQLSAWILIAGSVAVGWWYWKLPAADKLARLGKAGLTPLDQLRAGSPSASGPAGGAVPGADYQPGPGEFHGYTGPISPYPPFGPIGGG